MWFVSLHYNTEYPSILVQHLKDVIGKGKRQVYDYMLSVVAVRLICCWRASYRCINPMASVVSLSKSVFKVKALTVLNDYKYTHTNVLFERKVSCFWVIDCPSCCCQSTAGILLHSTLELKAKETSHMLNKSFCDKRSGPTEPTNTEQEKKSGTFIFLNHVFGLKFENGSFIFNSWTDS